MPVPQFLQDLYANLKALIEGAETAVVRKVKDVASWDGSASNYKDAAEYCNATLINLNTGAAADWTKSLCKLPVREPGDSAGVYVRQAIHAAAAALAGGRGGLKKPADVTQDKWDSAVKSAANELIAAYKEADEVAPDSIYEAAGKTPPKSDSTERTIAVGQVFHAVAQTIYEAQPQAWLNDLYVEDDGSLSALVSMEGKLYKAPVVVTGTDVTLGAFAEVMVEFTEVPRTRMTITRQADGKVRWFSVSCTAVLNRVGEIDSRDLFDNFLRHIEEGDADYPIRVFFHRGETFRTGQCDFVARDGNALITSGLYDDSDLARAEIAAREKEPLYWGESIGYLPLSEPVKVRVAEGVVLPAYTDGILNEISTLPEELAASLYTANTDLKGVNRMALEGKVYEAFVKLWGDEATAKKWLEEHPDAANRSIAENGQITRVAEPPAATTVTNAAPPATNAAEPPVQTVVTPPPATTTVTPPPVVRAVEITDDELAALAEKLLALPKFAELLKTAGKTAETVQAVQSDVAALGKTVVETATRSQAAARKLEDRLALVERSDEDKQAQWLADLPAQAVTRVTYRPREAHAGELPEKNMAEIAAATTAKLKHAGG